MWALGNMKITFYSPDVVLPFWYSRFHSPTESMNVRNDDVVTAVDSSARALYSLQNIADLSILCTPFRGSPNSTCPNAEKRFLEHCRALEAWTVFEFVQRHLQPSRRTRNDFFRDALATMSKVISLPENLFFEQTRMRKETFIQLSDLVEPYFRRPHYKRGPKPVPHICLLLFTLRALAHNIGSWALVTADWDVGKTTLTQAWIPKMCDILTMAIPLPKPLLRNDLSSWKFRSQGFESLAKLRVVKDANAKTRWRKELPHAYNAFLPIGEVYDGMVTSMSRKPKHVARGQEFRDYKSNTYALNNLIGVDSYGRVTTAVVGAPASVSDGRLFEQTKVYRGMENISQVDDKYRMPARYVVIADSGFMQREWVLTPFTVPEIEKAGRNKDRCRLYNFRLSQIRVVSENCFARMKGRWTMLRSIPFGPEVSGLIVYTACCLHNYVEKEGEEVLSSWLKQLSAADVEPTSVAFERVTRASSVQIPSGQRRRVKAASQLGWGWE